jgi:hypothetical protein
VVMVRLAIDPPGDVCRRKHELSMGLDILEG